MRKICFLIGNLNNSGGTERVATLLANNLVQKGYNVFIINLFEGDNPFFELDARINVFHLYGKQVSMKKNFFKTILDIRYIVTKNKIETLVDVDSIVSVFSIVSLFGLNVKHICWEHFYFKNDLGSIYRRLGRKLAAIFCDYVVTLTNKDKKYWEDSLSFIRADIISISNPCPYEDVVHYPKISNKKILAVGRLTYSKGFDLLLQIWGSVCNIYPDWTLTIVGGGEEQAKLEEYIIHHNLKNVLLVGQSRNVEDYYKEASLFCLTSRFEGLGMVLLEAQAYSLPIISFDCDVGPAEIITDNVNGYLVKDGDVEDFKDKLISFFNMSDREYSSLSEKTKLNSFKFKLDYILDRWMEIL